MTGELRGMPFAFICASILAGSGFLAWGEMSSIVADPLQPATAIAAINNPARKNLAIIGPASSLAIGTLNRPIGLWQIGGRLGRLTLKIDYRKR